MGIGDAARSADSDLRHCLVAGHIVAGGVRRVAMWGDALGSRYFGTDRAVRLAGAGAFDTHTPPLLESRNAWSLEWSETPVAVSPGRANFVVQDKPEDLP